MYARDFCYWLQGFMEINNPESITKEQLDIIKNHLNLAFHFDIDPPKEDKAPSSTTTKDKKVDVGELGKFHLEVC